jgi:hypothetical protein
MSRRVICVESDRTTPFHLSREPAAQDPFVRPDCKKMRTSTIAVYYIFTTCVAAVLSVLVTPTVQHVVLDTSLPTPSRTSITKKDRQKNIYDLSSAPQTVPQGTICLPFNNSSLTFPFRNLLINHKKQTYLRDIVSSLNRCKRCKTNQVANGGEVKEGKRRMQHMRRWMHRFHVGLERMKA